MYKLKISKTILKLKKYSNSLFHNSALCKKTFEHDRTELCSQYPMTMWLSSQELTTVHTPIRKSLGALTLSAAINKLTFIVTTIALTKSAGSLRLPLYEGALINSSALAFKKTMTMHLS
jgi:hypothetical protein